MFLPQIFAIFALIALLILAGWASDAIDRDTAKTLARRAKLVEVTRHLDAADKVAERGIHKVLIAEAANESATWKPLRDPVTFRSWFRDLRNLRALVLGTDAEHHVTHALGWATELHDHLRAHGDG